MVKVYEVFKDAWAKKGFWTVSSELGYSTFPTRSEAMAEAKRLKARPQEKGNAVVII